MMFDLKKIIPLLENTLQNPLCFLIIIGLIYVPIVYCGVSVEHYIEDEYVYYRMGEAIYRGLTPYQDFSTSHMPLMFYSVAFMYFIFNSASLGVGKLVPLLSSFVTLYFTYLVGEKVKRNAGIVACFLIVATSLHFHLYSHSMYGVFLCLAFVMPSFYFHMTERKTLSGLFAALSLLVRLNALYYLLAMAFLNRRRKEFFYGVFLAFPVFAYFLTVPGFVDDAFLYHAIEDPHNMVDRVNNLVTFLYTQRLLVLFYITGLYYALKNEGACRRILEAGDSTDRDSSFIVLYPILFTALTFTMQRIVYDYYFIMTLPFLSLVAALGVIRIFSLRNTLLTFVCVMLFLFGVYYSFPRIRNSYVSFTSDSVYELAGYISRNTPAQGRVFHAGGFLGPYIAMKANKTLGIDYIIENMHKTHVYRSRINESMKDVLDTSPDLVVTDFIYLNQMGGRGIDLSGFWSDLKKRYYPAYYVHDRGTSYLFAVWKPDHTRQLGPVFGEPAGTSTRYYLESYNTIINNTVFSEELVQNTTLKDSEAYVPESLQGRNIFNLTLLPADVLRWPLDSKTHYIIKNNVETFSEVWVSSIRDGRIGLSVLTFYNQSEVISLTYIIYDYNMKRVDWVACFSRANYPVTNRFYLTYQQIPLSESEYVKVKNLLDKLNKKEIGSTEYMQLRHKIISM